MKIFVKIFIVFILIISTIQISRADSIVLQNETLKGKINYILGNLVEISTKDGVKKIPRTVEEIKIRDIIKVGFIKKKIITGKIFYADDDTIEMLTSSGTLKLHRFFVRDIILSAQEAPGL